MSRTLVRSVAVAACFFAVVAFAQPQPPEIARSVAWLTGHAHPAGSLASEATSIALPLQFWSVTQSTPPSTTGSIAGKVVDAASGTSLPGVTVRINDAAVVATSVAEGSFNVTAVAPGSIGLGSHYGARHNA
jgi:hypothetical protein